MSLRLLYAAVKGEFAQAMLKMREPMAIAAMGAMREAAQSVKQGGRATIAAAGFSRKWQNAFRVNLYPERGVSIDPAIFAYHKIPYAGVFETGAVIKGNPMLWLPLDKTPAKIGGKRFTPRNYVAQIGPLRATRSKRGNPILLGKIQGGVRGPGKITLAKLRAGQQGGPRSVWVPLFVGVPLVKIRRHFDLAAVFRKARSEIPADYFKHLPASY